MRSFPWDSIATIMGDNGFPIYDRAFSSNDLRKVCGLFFSPGVYIGEPESFQVIADEGMNVIVNPGMCHINGGIGWEEDYRKLAIQAPSSQDRIDTVVIRSDGNIDARDVDLYIKKGVAQDVPERPDLIQNDTVWELGIADIFVAKNTPDITQERITDTRMEDARCGIMTPLLNVNTTQFFEQLQAAVSRAVELADSALDGTIPGQLQSQIDELKDDNESQDSRIDGIVQSFNSTVTSLNSNISTAQSTANTANNLAINAQNKADLAYNLANGTGEVIRIPAGINAIIPEDDYTIVACDIRMSNGTSVVVMDLVFKSSKSMVAGSVYTIGVLTTLKPMIDAYLGSYLADCIINGYGNGSINVRPKSSIGAGNNVILCGIWLKSDS